jgi:hypothetical protein
MRFLFVRASFLAGSLFCPPARVSALSFSRQKTRLRGTPNTCLKPALFCSLEEGSAVMGVTQASVRAGTDTSAGFPDWFRPSRGFQSYLHWLVSRLFLIVSISPSEDAIPVLKYRIFMQRFARPSRKNAASSPQVTHPRLRKSRNKLGLTPSPLRRCFRPIPAACCNGSTARAGAG